jgi:glycine/D-amino acid oxidase-like deaminating enzyme
MGGEFAGNAADDRFAFRRRMDGGYSIAAGARHDFFIGPDAFRHARVFSHVLRKDFRSTSFHVTAPRDYPDAWRTRRRWAADRPSPFEAVRILNPAPNMGFLASVQDNFAAALPHLGRPVIADAWAGMIDTIPDVVPILDRAPGISGLVIATGLCGHGFGIGPGVGRVVADLVAGHPVRHDLHRFRFSRFTDGSTLDLAPTL